MLLNYPQIIVDIYHWIECVFIYKVLYVDINIYLVVNLFTCSYCKKGFTQSHHLKRHLRIHTGVTPYRCRFCERPFKYNTSCRRHERTVHKDVYRPETTEDNINHPDYQKDGNEDGENGDDDEDGDITDNDKEEENESENEEDEEGTVDEI